MVINVFEMINKTIVYRPLIEYVNKNVLYYLKLIGFSKNPANIFQFMIGYYSLLK